MQVGQQMARLPIVETNIVWPEKEFQKWSTKQEKKEKKPEKEDLKVEHKTGEKAKKDELNLQQIQTKPTPLKVWWRKQVCWTFNIQTKKSLDLK